MNINAMTPADVQIQRVEHQKAQTLADLESALKRQADLQVMARLLPHPCPTSVRAGPTPHCPLALPAPSPSPHAFPERAPQAPLACHGLLATLLVCWAGFGFCFARCLGSWNAVFILWLVVQPDFILPLLETVFFTTCADPQYRCSHHVITGIMKNHLCGQECQPQSIIVTRV